MPNDGRSGAWRWTDEEHAIVEALAAAGLPAGRVAKALGCEVRTLTRRYSADLFETGKRGRKPTHFTPEQRELVEAMAGFGIPHEEIAVVLNTGVESLYEHFREELATASTKANAKVAGFLFTQAKTNTSAAIFWLKVRAGWKETTHVDVNHSGGVDLAVADTLTGLTSDELVELRALARRAEMRQVEGLTG